MAEARATGFPGSFGLELGDLGLDLLCGLEMKESQPLLEPVDLGLSLFRAVSGCSRVIWVSTFFAA